MKKLIFFGLLAIILVGCKESASPTESLNDVLSSTDTTGAYSDLAILSKEEVEFDNFKEKYTHNYTVSGEKGGILFLKVSWRDVDSLKIQMDAKLTIPKGAYTGSLTFDMIFDLENYALELYPSPFKFIIPVKLDLKFTNVDLINFDADELMFAYLDGEETMEYKSMVYDFIMGRLDVKGAILYHFSRYGWTRTTTTK